MSVFPGKEKASWDLGMHSCRPLKQGVLDSWYLVLPAYPSSRKHGSCIWTPVSPHLTDNSSQIPGTRSQPPVNGYTHPSVKTWKIRSIQGLISRCPVEFECRSTVTVELTRGQVVGSEMPMFASVSPVRGENPRCKTHMASPSDLLAPDAIRRKTQDSKNVQILSMAHGSNSHPGETFRTTRSHRLETHTLNPCL